MTFKKKTRAAEPAPTPADPPFDLDAHEAAVNAELAAELEASGDIVPAVAERAPDPPAEPERVVVRRVQVRSPWSMAIAVVAVLAVGVGIGALIYLQGRKTRRVILEGFERLNEQL